MAKLYYKDDNVAIIHGDCIEAMSKLKKPFDACITDPPYVLKHSAGGRDALSKRMYKNSDAISFISQGFYCRRTIDMLSTLTKAQNVLMFCSNDQLLELLTIAADNNLKSTVTAWNKTNPPPVAYSNYNSDLEFILWMRSKGAYFNNDEVFEIKRKCKRYPIVSHKGRLHPTQKPIPLMEELVRLHSPIGGRILDPFCGSGTTLIAGLNTGRKVVGIEMDEKYCEIAKQRVLEWYKEHK